MWVVLSAWAAPIGARPPVLQGGATCFQIAQAVSTAVAQMPWEPDVVVILEEESICGGAQRSVGPWSFRPRGFVMPDDPDLDALLAAAEAYDAELGAAFRAQHERTKTGIPAKPYSAQDLEDVIRQAAAKVRAEVPTAATASVSRTGGVVRVTASSEPVLDRRVTVGAASCPTVRQFPEGTLRDDLRCAFEGIPGMAIPMSPILTGGNWILTPSTAPASPADAAHPNGVPPRLDPTGPRPSMRRGDHRLHRSLSCPSCPSCLRGSPSTSVTSPSAQPRTCVQARARRVGRARRAWASTRSGAATPARP
jgi:hypothetical protein